MWSLGIRPINKHILLRLQPYMCKVEKYNIPICVSLQGNETENTCKLFVTWFLQLLQQNWQKSNAEKLTIKKKQLTFKTFKIYLLYIYIYI